MKPTMASMATLGGWVVEHRGRPVQQHRLSDLGRIECCPVDSTEALTRWEALLDAEHFLGAGPLVGPRLRYLVRSKHFGDVAALGETGVGVREAGVRSRNTASCILLDAGHVAEFVQCESERGQPRLVIERIGHPEPAVA